MYIYYNEENPFGRERKNNSDDAVVVDRVYCCSFTSPLASEQKNYQVFWTFFMLMGLVLVS